MPDYLIQEEATIDTEFLSPLQLENGETLENDGFWRFLLEEGDGFIVLEESEIIIPIYRPLRTVLGSSLRNV